MKTGKIFLFSSLHSYSEITMKKIFLFLTILYLSCSNGIHAQSIKVEDLCKNSSVLNSNMWWKNSLKTQSPLIFEVQTNKYAFKFDYEKLVFNSFSISGSKQEIDNNPPDISFGIETYGKLYPCKQSSLRVEDCQLIHTGRFLQHRFINWIPELNGCDPYQSGLDIISWNDRLTLSLRVVPTVILRSNAIVINYTIPSNYQKQSSPEGWAVYKHTTGTGGYIITKSTDNTHLSFSGNKIEARLNSTQKLQPEQLYQTGLIIYPVEDVEKELNSIIHQETNPLVVSAEQIQPVNTSLITQYDPAMGWHSIQLRNDISGETVKDNDRMEQVKFTIENNNSSEATVRLNFSKENEVYAVPGISGIIRDQEGYPTGIPVQLSKNWHTTDFNNYDSHLYKGPWFHGLSVLRIPANSKITLEYSGVNAHWGGVPAASHAQLCLVGWGSNQQWDQSAIGAWGESICYEPDLDQASAAVLDVRPLLITDPKGQQWGWTGNVGGADILNLRRNDGTRAWHTAMKTDYKRYCPNLTEVIYSGNMLDQKIDFQYATSITRSDDITRGIYKIRMNVKDNIEFDKLDIFQLGAATYHYGFSKEIALGNEKGLIKKWKANNNTHPVNDKSKKSFSGNTPWFFLYDSPISKDQEGRFVSGNRGFIIRKWDSRVNGKTNIPPYWSEYITTEGAHGNPCSIITVTLPENCHTLSAGDYIEAEIELFVTPLTGDDYYGPNTYFKTALSKFTNKWPLAYREAKGNNIIVTPVEGTVEDNYPIVISAINDQAHFKTKGGIGYVPITIRQLSGYKKPALYIKKGNQWTQIDQSTYGNDYWQTDFDPTSGTWEMTYNIRMDSEGDKPVEREFKFKIGE